MSHAQDQPQIVHGNHQLLVGNHRGLYVCVCLDCGKFLGALRKFSTISTLDRAHECPCSQQAEPRSRAAS